MNMPYPNKAISPGTDFRGVNCEGSASFAKGNLGALTRQLTS